MDKIQYAKELVVECLFADLARESDDFFVALEIIKNPVAPSEALDILAEKWYHQNDVMEALASDTRTPTEKLVSMTNYKFQGRAWKAWETLSKQADEYENRHRNMVLRAEELVEEIRRTLSNTKEADSNGKLRIQQRIVSFLAEAEIAKEELAKNYLFRYLEDFEEIDKIISTIEEKRDYANSAYRNYCKCIW